MSFTVKQYSREITRWTQCGCSRRILSTTSLEAPSSPHSHRRAFRELPLLSGTLERIQKLGFGERVRRSRRQRRFNPVDEQSWRRPPPPFQDARPSVRILTENHEKIPQVALLGRSNVGKSTLLNALLYGNRTREQKFPKGHKAITSPRPGETRQTTIYDLASFERKPDKTNWKHQIQLVDLPGYGFSFSSDDLSSLVTTFLLTSSRKQLKRALLLIDARHGMKKADVDFLHNLERQQKQVVPLQIVLTKCDMIPDPQVLARRVIQVRQQLSDCMQRETSRLPVLLTSVQTGRMRGVFELQRDLASLVVPQRIEDVEKSTNP